MSREYFDQFVPFNNCWGEIDIFEKVMINFYQEHILEFHVEYVASDFGTNLKK